MIMRLQHAMLHRLSFKSKNGVISPTDKIYHINLLNFECQLKSMNRHVRNYVITKRKFHAKERIYKSKHLINIVAQKFEEILKLETISKKKGAVKWFSWCPAYHLTIQHLSKYPLRFLMISLLNKFEKSKEVQNYLFFACFSSIYYLIFSHQICSLFFKWTSFSLSTENTYERSKKIPYYQHYRSSIHVSKNRLYFEEERSVEDEYIMKSK